MTTQPYTDLPSAAVAIRARLSEDAEERRALRFRVLELEQALKDVDFHLSHERVGLAQVTVKRALRSTRAGSALRVLKGAR